MTKFLKNVFFSLIVFVTVFSILEVATRICASAQSGNKTYLKWGFVPSDLQEKSKQHIELFDGYFKMKKNQVHQNLSWATKPVRINSTGFRGRDFTKKPDRGVIRVIALGESSTFCYEVNDDETWPFLLEQKLNAHNAGHPYEVINAGIPFMRTQHVRELVDQEILSYEPRIAPIYLGHNNAYFLFSQIIRARQKKKSLFDRVWLFKEWTKTKILFFNLALEWKGKKLPSKQFSGTMEKLTAPILLTKKEEDKELVNAAVAEFRADVLHIVRALKQKGTTPILVTQCVSMHYFFDRYKLNNQDLLKGYDHFSSTEAALRFVSERYERGEAIYDFELEVLLNSYFAQAIRSVAKEESVTLADFRNVPQPLTRYLKTYVHLNREGTGLLSDFLRPFVERAASPDHEANF